MANEQGVEYGGYQDGPVPISPDSAEIIAARIRGGDYLTSFNRLDRWSGRIAATLTGLGLGGFTYAFANGQPLTGLLSLEAGALAAFVTLMISGDLMERNVNLPRIPNIIPKNPFRHR